jgi:O-antigen ligase
MVAGWIATVLLVVPMASLAYTKQLYLAASWLPYSARHRIVIWGYTSDQIAKAPVLGAGISTARALNDRDDEHPVLAPGSTFRLTTGWHSHNAYLQAWYETGAVGALLLLGIGLLAIRALASARADVQPFLYATFVSGALMAGSSFSLWAPWFVASLCLAAVFAALLSELASRQGRRADAEFSQAPPVQVDQPISAAGDGGPV